MPRTRSTALHDLIKTLKPSERRYFNLWASRDGSGDHKFIHVFNAICEQDEHDEDELLRRVPGLSESQLSNMKAHLYQRVLQCMRQYNWSHAPEVQLREMIDNVHLLFNRGLFDQCVDLLKKARKRVERIDNLELQLEILKWEKNILTQTIGAGNEQRVNRIVDEVQTVNDRINNVNKFTNLAARLNAIYYRIGFIRNRKDYERIQRLIRNELPSLYEEDLS